MDTLFVGLRVVVSLGAVLGLLWVIQRKVAKSGRVTRTAKHVVVVARQGISGKASVAVVDVEGVRYVLGVTEQSVSVLGSGEAPADAVVTTLATKTVVDAPVQKAVQAPVPATAHDHTKTKARATTRSTFIPATAAGFAEALAAETVVASPRRAARAAAVTPTAAAPLAGSILSASTWKQAAAAMRQQKRA